MFRDIVVGVCALSVVGSACGSIVPFTEEFGIGVSNWRDVDGADTLAWFAAGGPDGSSYVSTTYTVPDPIPPFGAVLFRGHDAYDSSNDSFVGNWITDGVREFSFWVRHDAVMELGLFARFANPSNFPGAAGISFVPVAPNTWTEIVIPIFAGSPNIILEGSPFNDVFSNIGNVQIGASVTADMIGQTITFDLDNVSITPAPGALGLLAVAGLIGSRKRRPVVTARR
jgi:MYXO-CTERM domain-containing protein